jgi:hypothetical protein
MRAVAAATGWQAQIVRLQGGREGTGCEEKDEE